MSLSKLTPAQQYVDDSFCLNNLMRNTQEKVGMYIINIYLKSIQLIHAPNHPLLIYKIRLNIKLD